MATTIAIEDITKTFHLGELDVPVLKGINFAVENGSGGPDLEFDQKTPILCQEFTGCLEI